MKKIGIIMVPLILVIVGTVGCIDMSTDDNWEFEILAETWTQVTFTQEMFDCLGTTDPEDIFRPYATDGYELHCFQEHPIEGWKAWSSVLDPIYITLYDIVPDVPCEVYSEEFAFTLVIEGC